MLMYVWNVDRIIMGIAASKPSAHMSRHVNPITVFDFRYRLIIRNIGLFMASSIENCTNEQCINTV